MHRPNRNCLAVALVALGLISLAAETGTAQITRTIKLILPFPPGGPADAMARIVAEQIGTSGGPSFVVESHPGAGTEIGTELVARAAPDGNTLAIISNSFVVLPHLRKLNYDPLADFAPICELASFPPLIVVNSDSPYHTLADLVDAVHAHPGTLTLGTLGPATASQMAFEMLKQVAKLDMTFIPFPGYTPAIQALLGNQISSALADLSSLQGQLQTGKVRALATTVTKRIAALPDVPTVAESGYKDFAAQFFGAVVAPAQTPKTTIDQLIAWFTPAIEAEKVTAKFKALGFYPATACGADFAAILRKEYDGYGQIVREAKIRSQ